MVAKKELKKCTKCYKEKPLSEFYDKKRSKARKDGTVHHWVGKYAKCKKCTDIVNKERRPLYEDYYKQYRIDNRGKIRERIRQHYILTMKNWVEILSTYMELKCVKCGYDEHYAALDFHHVNPKDKVISIHAITKQGVPTPERVALLESEIEKCVVLCSNCHRIEHAEYNHLDSI